MSCLFIAGLRNISSEIYEAAALDGAGRWTQFRRITWPLIWPVTALVLTIQLILQLKIFDQVYLFAANVRYRCDDGDGAVHLETGVPGEQRRSRRRRVRGAVRGDRRRLGAAISTPAGPRRAMTAAAEAGQRTCRGARVPPARALAPFGSRRRRHHACYARSRGRLGVPALLGARNHVQAGIRSGAAGRANFGRSTSRSKPTSTC